MGAPIFQELGLIEADGQPGSRWGEFTRSFDRTDKTAMQTLGGLASHLVLGTIESERMSDYGEVAKKFGKAAEPPIPSGDEGINESALADEDRPLKSIASAKTWGAMSFYNGISRALQASLESGQASSTEAR